MTYFEASTLEVLPLEALVVDPVLLLFLLYLVSVLAVKVAGRR